MAAVIRSRSSVRDLSFRKIHWRGFVVFSLSLSLSFSFVNQAGRQGRREKERKVDVKIEDTYWYNLMVPGFLFSFASVFLEIINYIELYPFDIFTAIVYRYCLFFFFFFFFFLLFFLFLYFNESVASRDPPGERLRVYTDARIDIHTLIYPHM